LTYKTQVPQTGLAKLRDQLKDKLVDAQIRPKRNSKTHNQFKSLPISPMPLNNNK